MFSASILPLAALARGFEDGSSVNDAVEIEVIKNSLMSEEYLFPQSSLLKNIKKDAPMLQLISKNMKLARK